MIMAGVVGDGSFKDWCWNIFDAPLKIDDLLFLFTDLSVQGSRVQEGFEAVHLSVRWEDPPQMVGFFRKGKNPRNIQVFRNYFLNFPQIYRDILDI